MTSRLPPPVIAINAGQENAIAKSLGKSMINNKAQPIKRGALGDLGNTIHFHQNNNDTLKSNVMGPPMAMAKKKIEVAKKIVPPVSKENVPKKNNENSNTQSKVNCRKPIRQESILFPKILQQTKKEVVETTKIAEPTKELLYDPDENTKGDPQMVTEYIQDILTYVRSIEDDFPIRDKFLENTKVTPKMRTTLVNWLVDAHRNFSLGLETLHLCVTIVDRYLQVNKSVDRSIYQLVGTAALLLSSKYEEIYTPDLEDFVFICDDAFTKKQILQMEIDIFKKLDFRMGWPTSIFFLRRYSKIAAVKSDQHTLAKYILELALLEYNLAHIKPSIQAAAACCLSIAIINESMNLQKVWNPTLVHYTKYKYSDFQSVLYELAHLIVRAETSKFDSVRQKYSASKYNKISLSFKLQGPLIRKLTLSPTLSRK